jgi:hypothetical protein
MLHVAIRLFLAGLIFFGNCPSHASVRQTGLSSETTKEKIRAFSACSAWSASKSFVIVAGRGAFRTNKATAQVTLEQ